MFESSYVEYLRSARTSVQNCVNACRAWTAPYDGENPTTESFSDNHREMSANRSAADENVKLDAGKNTIPNSQDEVNKLETNNELQAAAVDSATIVSSSNDNTPSSITVDDRISQADVVTSSDNQPSAESVGDDGEVLLTAAAAADDKQEQSYNELDHTDSSTNQDTAQPIEPPENPSAVSASDDLESFFRQLSLHVSCKTDTQDSDVDILLELDKMLGQLDTQSEDIDSQKTLTPEDQPTADFAENFPPQSNSDEANAAAASDAAAVSTCSSRTDHFPSSNAVTLDTNTPGGKILVMSTDNDKDDDQDNKNDDVLYASPFSVLLWCKYEPPYQPTIGMYHSHFLYLSKESG